MRTDFRLQAAGPRAPNGLPSVARLALEIAGGVARRLRTTSMLPPRSLPAIPIASPGSGRQTDRRSRLPVAAASLASLLGLLAVTGCGGGLSHRVDNDKLKDMSRQGQIWIYDAENEIVVGLDRLDDARDELRAVERRLKKAEEAVDRAEKRGNRMAVEMAEEWVKYLEAMQRWAKARIKAQQVGVTSAEAAVELAKAQVINREDLLGGKNFSIVDYQTQYDEWKKEYERDQKKAVSLRKSARKMEQRWWVLRRRNIAQSGDFDTGLWVE